MTDTTAHATPHRGAATMEQRNPTAPDPPAPDGGPPLRRGYLLTVAGGFALLLLAAAAFVGLLMGGIFDRTNDTSDDEIARLKAGFRSRSGAAKPRRSPADVAVRGGAVGASAALPAGPGQRPENSATAERAAAQRDARLRSAIVGEWELPEDGLYRLALRADNTGTLVYKPSGLNKAALLTSRLEISIEWTLEDGHIDMNSVSGTPTIAFKVAIASRGQRKYYRIDELTGDKLVLYELKRRKTKQWTKVQ
ncbi:MAG: hypothetical protein ACE5KM_12865 [Planctomycetaceae bacterium]